MKHSLLYILLIMAVAGCSDGNINPTIKPQTRLSKDSCISQFDGYYERFGYDVSNYFQFTSVASKDLNQDGIADSIAILSPVELLPEYELCHKSVGDSVEGRLLLINLMTENGDALQKFRYDHAVSIEPSSRIKNGSEALSMPGDQPGMILSQDYGQGCFAKYSIHIKFLQEESDFAIDSIVFRDFCPGSDSVERVRYHPLPSRPFMLKDYRHTALISFKREFGVLN